MDTKHDDSQFYIIKEKIFEYWSSEKIDIWELCVLLYLIKRANIKTGIVIINYKIIAEEIRDIKKYFKDPENKVNKIMISLKRNQLIWFDKHRGTNKKIAVEIDNFALGNKNYTDIGRKFIDKPNVIEQKIIKKFNKPAEVFIPQQKLRELNKSKYKLKNKMSFDATSRTPQIDKIDNIDNIESISTLNNISKYAMDIFNGEFGEESVNNAINKLNKEIEQGVPIKDYRKSLRMLLKTSCDQKGPEGNTP